jgi:murein L,D-transpeptidase YafK
MAAMHILIDKAARTLRVLVAGAVSRTHRVRLSANAAVDKQVEGDGATPLGEFYVCAKNPRSRYFLSLCLSYPNAEDAERGLRDALIDAAEFGAILEAIRERRMPPQKTRLGGEIYIHGHALDQGTPAAADWTRGCIALDNRSMLDLYDTIRIGTPVEIRP